MEEIRLGSRTLQPGRQLLAEGERVPIGRRALDILSFLAHAHGEIVTKDELLGAVWPDVIVEENALQVHVVALRKALGPEADRLKTIRGVGYQLHIDVEGDVQASSSAPYPELAPSAPTEFPEGLASIEAAAAWATSAQADSRQPATRSGSGPPKKMFVLPGTRILAILVAALLLGAWTLYQAIGPPAQDQISLVVRPLAASGAGDRTEVAMASGITDELIVRLRRIPDLQVTKAEADVPVTGGALGNGYTVDGTIRSSDDRIRVTARLSNAAGRILWMQTFDRQIADLFAIQEEIATAIASELSVSLDVGVDSTEYGGTDNPEAFAAYLQFTTHRLDQDQGVPLRYLQRALRLDPTYVKALSGQAIWYGMQARRATTKEDAQNLLKKMRDGTLRTLAENPDLWIGHMTQGWYSVYSKDYRSADKSFQRVASLDEGTDPELRGFLSSHALMMGRTQDSLSLLASNALIDPTRRDDRSQVWALSQAGRHEEAVDLFERLAPVFQDSVAGNAFWAHLLLGGEAEALPFAEEHIPRLANALRGFKTNKELPAMSAAELETWARSQYGEGGHLDLATAAAFAGYFGHPKLAVELLRQSFARVGATQAMFWNPVLASTRKTDEFERLMADLGLVDYWRESGNWPDACQPASATEIVCH